MNSMTLWLQRQQFSWREFFILIFIGVLANIYFLTNYSPSIDDELAAVRTSGEIWIAQGRFTVYLVETLLFPQPSIPFSPYMFLVVMSALTHMLLLRAHDVMPSWRSYAAYCLFVTYPTWWLIGEFSANVPATGVGLLLVSTALVLHANKIVGATNHFTRQAAGRLFTIGLALAMCAGAYQTLLLLFACGVLGIALCRSIGGTGPFAWRPVFIQIAHGGVSLIASAILYLALNKVALVVSNTQPEYISSLIKLDNLRAPWWLFGSIVQQAWHFYSGAADLFGAAMPAAAVALFLGAAAAAYARHSVALPHLLLFAALVGTPFLLHILTGPGLPLRAMVSLPYVFWLCALLTFTWLRGAVWLIGLSVFALFQLQIINLTSQYAATANTVQHHDRFMGFEIGRRLQLLRPEAGVDGPIFLDTYGSGMQDIPSLFASANCSATRGSFFGWDSGNLKRIVAYMQVLGFKTVHEAPPDTRGQHTKLFEQMPAWPEEGSLILKGNYYLLKLGNKPDKAHGGFSKNSC